MTSATVLPRTLHPLAWWGWAIGLAVAASLTLNPLLLVLIVTVVALVVGARRSDSPWARAFKLYVLLGLSIIVIRVVLHVLVGFKAGTTRILSLPSVELPSWAAGIDILGDVYLEGLVAALLLAAQLAALIIALGGANALANPKRLLRNLPSALHEVGTAVVVAVSVAPQLADSVQRVFRARLLRGDSRRGLRALPRVALPVLQDTLDRSLMLAAAMESRGYGRVRVPSEAESNAASDTASAPAARFIPGRLGTGVLTLGGLLLLAFGMYGLLDPTTVPGWSGLPVLIAGSVAVAVGLWVSGRRVQVTRYRPDRWQYPETITLLAGWSAAAGVIADRFLDPAGLTMSTQPLLAPPLPVLATLGILVALAPAVLTPPPPRRGA